MLCNKDEYGKQKTKYLVQDDLILLIRQLLCLDHLLQHQHCDHLYQKLPQINSNLEVSIDHEVVIFSRTVAHRAGPSRLLLVHHEEQRGVETLKSWLELILDSRDRGIYCNGISRFENLKMVAGCGSAGHRHPHLTQWATHCHLGMVIKAY